MAKLINWSDELVMGVPEVDAHHKTLVEILNGLHQAVHRRRGVDVCREKVEKLRRCVLSHLNVEEKLMHLSGYTAFGEDLKEQRELIRQLDEMLVRMDADSSNITFHALHQLKTWMLAHIRGVDPRNAEGLGAAANGTGLKVFGVSLKRG